MKRAILGLAVVAAACGQPDQPAPKPTPTATMAAERTLVASDYDPKAFGAKVGGPDAKETEVELTAMGKPLGAVTSYVACKAEGDACDPETAPEGTVYTYVHRITLAELPAATPTPSPSPTASPGAEASATPSIVEIGPTLFRQTRPAPGFNLAVGYSLAQAKAALGKEDAIKVTLDRNQLVWRVTGGNGWAPGATITVWWQSTQPPAGDRKAYLLEVDGKQADVSAPFPAEEKPVTQ